MEFAKKIGQLLLILTLFAGCRTTKNLPAKTKHLKQLIETNTSFNDGFTGFTLYDLKSKKTIWQQDADKYFTPASNTKILTLYTALNILEAYPTALHFNHQDSITTFRGSGNPGFLNDLFPDSTNTGFQFLAEQQKPLRFCDCNFQDKRYGAGWSWDDYHYAFQTEQSPFPIYGNTVRFETTSHPTDLMVFPEYFKQQLSQSTENESPKIKRSWDQNDFKYSGNSEGLSSTERPFRTSTVTTLALLADTLKKSIDWCGGQCTVVPYDNIKGSVSSKQMYQQLMQPSDNFVAEQLLLLCADKLFDTLKVSRAIEWSLDSLMNDLTDKPKWVDGSGLSRYNKATPRSIVEILEKLYTQLPEDELFDIFPTGGESGTIKNWYGGLGRPYVFAKTGTLRHVHCLSGYIKTASGGTLIFSFMHNNYTCPTRELKLQMEMVLRYIYLRY